MALGVLLQNKVYRWSEDMSEEAIEKRIADDQAARVASVALIILFGLAFFLSIVLLITNASIFRVFSVTFWVQPSLEGVFLLLTGLIGALWFSHASQTSRHVVSMPKLSLREIIPQILELEPQKKEINVADLFDVSAHEAVENAFSLANKFGHKTLEPLHLFLGSMDDSNAGAVLSRLGLSFDSMKEPLARRLEQRQLGKPMEFSVSSIEAILTAFLNSFEQQRVSVTALEIFYEAFKRDLFIQELILDLGIQPEQFSNMIEWVRIHERMRERYEQFSKAAMFKPTGAMNRAMTSVATPVLDSFSEDLTTAAVQGRLPLLVGRDQELEEIFRIIEGGRESVVLVGPEGVGRTSLLEGIAQLMVEERVPAMLQDKRLMRLSVPHLISGATPSEAQERLLTALNEVARSGNIVLAVTDIEQMTGFSVGDGESIDLAGVLVDFLSRSGLFAIATTSPRAYTSVIENSILSRVFQKVDIREPSEQEAIHILESKIGAIEFQHSVVFTYLALEKCVQLTDRFMHEQFLPKKAVEIARETALFVAKTKGKDSFVTDQDIARIVSEKTNVPLTNIQEEEKDKLVHLEERMHERMVGQEEAVTAVAGALRRARTDLRAENRPIAAFLFLGPTGVGKTELAKTIAQTYFGNEESMVRLDMSEYQDPSSIHRLIGEPNSQDGGLLTEAVRKNPFTIVLLDEFEKADKNILNVFLQVFDDGRLTDASGRTVDFTNTVLIATSNAGTQYIQDSVVQGVDVETMKTHLIEQELRGQYRPELLNRFDGIIVFKPLTKDEILQIARLMIAQVSKRLETKGISFRASDEMVALLADKGYDPTFGARPLRRVIQEEVDNAIANVLLEGTVRRRDTIVLEIGGIRIEKAETL